MPDSVSMARAHPPSHDAFADANAIRRAGRWSEARDAYAALLPGTVGSTRAALLHNLGLCCMALGEPEAALGHCDAALALDASLRQSRILRAKALRSLGRNALALQALQELPDGPEVRLETASLALHELGDAALAQALAQPLLAERHQERVRSDARLTTLIAQLYDRVAPAHVLAAELRAFGASRLTLPAVPARVAPRQAQARARPRVGLISPHFCCSPVYFFCFGALRLVAQACDLVFFNRGSRDDWATGQLRGLAHDWFDVAGWQSDSLAAFLHGQSLDCLIDLGGWMDPTALRALSTRPARKMYKWVGGQSASTGLSAFDGMLTDVFQSPPSFQPLYSEPLLQLASGYVTYTPPPYMPLPGPGPAGMVLGIISHPAKVSSGFLSFTRQRIVSLPPECHAGLQLVFIDRRYADPAVQARIVRALGALPVPVRFVVPASHEAYLREVGRLTAVIDTFPYSGGLTTIEAMALGVPCLTRTGVLFSERHTYSHCRHAGLTPHQFDLERLLDRSLFGVGGPGPIRGQRSLLASTPRVDHESLARELCRYIHEKQDARS